MKHPSLRNRTFDFHGLSIQTTKLALHYGVTKTKVTEAITLTLLLRSVGACMFGVFSDYYGRKYPLVINMWMLGVLQVGSIYCQNFNQFLAVRAGESPSRGRVMVMGEA